MKNILDLLGNNTLSLLMPSFSNPNRANWDKENFGFSANLTEKFVSFRDTIKTMMDSIDSEEELENQVPSHAEVLI